MTRRRAIILACVALVVCLDVFLWMRLVKGGDDDADSPAAAPGTATASSSDSSDGATTAPTPSGGIPSSAGATSSEAPSQPAITLETADRSVPMLTVVKLTGRYPGAAPGTQLRVQRSVNGTWVDFPLPTVVQPTGRFVTRVQMGGTGTNELRVIEPVGGDRSNTVAIEIS